MEGADSAAAGRAGGCGENRGNDGKGREKLEEVACSVEGVESCYAIQAGREIRVMVKPEKVSDEQMTLLARDICKKIEADLDYPGTIKVNMIRESRTVDYAK